VAFLQKLQLLIVFSEHRIDMFDIVIYRNPVRKNKFWSTAAEVAPGKEKKKLIYNKKNDTRTTVFLLLLLC
jgi:hypothetical protein